jgi:antitoxin (DNA-binding transcriptional repressor) of toxin-antitoxin stability system
MSVNVATIRELRTDFRSVKRKIEQYGEVTITDRGQAAYVLKSVPQRHKLKAPPRDYYARLLERQPRALSPRQTKAFWEDERR